MKAFLDVAITNNKYKNNTRYIDTPVALQMTQDFLLYITPDLDHQTAEIETASSIIFKTQGIATINIDVLVGNDYIQIDLSNVHYLHGFDTNLISLGIFEEKKSEFYAMNSML